jgi:transposase-like protein
MRLIKSASSDELLPFIKDNVQLGSTVVTDGWPAYSKLKSEGYTHKVKKICEDKEALPHVHLAISLLKRWLYGTYQGSVSHEKLDYYLDEFTFRFNLRKSNSRGKLFMRLVQQAVQTPPFTGREIVEGKQLNQTREVAKATQSCSSGSLSKAHKNSSVPNAEVSVVEDVTRVDESLGMWPTLDW